MGPSTFSSINGSPAADVKVTADMAPVVEAINGLSRTVGAFNIVLDVPPQEAPVIKLEPPSVTTETPIIVNVPAAQVHLKVEPHQINLKIPVWPLVLPVWVLVGLFAARMLWAL